MSHRWPQITLRGTIGWLLSAILCAGIAAAQTTVDGTIRGVITDQAGARVPGASIVANSPTVAGDFRAESDADGSYRLIGLPPGEYSVTVVLAGFSKVERRGILMRAGMNLGLDITMSVGTITEQIEVRGESPMLDVSSPVQAVNITGELQRMLPTSPRRDYTDFLEMTPGMNSYVSPSRGAGLYHMRGSRIESHVVQVDGADMSSLRQARPDYIGMSTDTLEDVQIKSSVSDASAPLGNGAVISVATPTGSNRIHGAASYAYAGRSWNADNNPGGETNSSSLSLFDGSAGAPVMKDRLWVFGSYRKIARQIGLGGRTSELIALARALHGSQWNPFDNAFKGTFYFLKGTAQLGRHRVDGFYQYDFSPTESNYFESTRNSSVSTFGGKGASGRVWSSWGSAVTTRFGVNYNDKSLNARRSDLDGYLVDGIPQRPVHYGTFLSSGLITGTGMVVNAGIENSYTVTPAEKLTLSGDLTWYRSGWLGRHNLQAGFYLQPRLKGGTTVYYPNNGLATEEVVLRDRSNPSAGYIPFHRVMYDPSMITRSTVTASDNAYYIQDAWSPAQRLTITAGIRFDKVKATDKLARVRSQDSLEIGPRLGATLGLTKDFRTVAYGSWGRVHDLVALADIPTLGSASPTVTHLYDNDLNGSFETTRVTPGGTSTTPNNRIDPKRHQPFIDEWTLGVRRQLPGQITVSAGYAQREYKDRPAQVERNGIYDGVVFKGYGALDDRLNQIYEITNDIWNSQVYQAIETMFTKRSRNLQMVGSYVRQWRHLAGTWQPNDNAAFVQPAAFANNKAIGTPRVAPSNSLPPGGADVFGNTAWQDHTLRISAIYELPRGFRFGTHYVYQSGPYTGPIVKRIDAPDPRFGPTNVRLPNGRVVTNPLATTIRFAFADRGQGQVKADARQELNLRLSKAFRMGERYRLELGVDLFNVTNQGAIERWASGAGQLYSPQYLAPTSKQPPRSVDVTAKFIF